MLNLLRRSWIVLISQVYYTNDDVTSTSSFISYARALHPFSTLSKCNFKILNPGQTKQVVSKKLTHIVQTNPSNQELFLFENSVINCLLDKL